MATAASKKFLLVNNLFNIFLYFYILISCYTSAPLLGGVGGFYLINITNNIYGIVTNIA